MGLRRVPGHPLLRSECGVSRDPAFDRVLNADPGDRALRSLPWVGSAASLSDMPQSAGGAARAVARGPLNDRAAVVRSGSPG